VKASPKRYTYRTRNRDRNRDLFVYRPRNLADKRFPIKGADLAWEYFEAWCDARTDNAGAAWWHSLEHHLGRYPRLEAEFRAFEATYRFHPKVQPNHLAGWLDRACEYDLSTQRALAP
jgi:hypothetical protein